MHRVFLALFFCCLFSKISIAQKQKIDGKLISDVEKKPVYNAVVALLTPKDSIIYAFTRSDEAGNFILKNIDTGNYIFITTHNRFGDYTDEINISTTDKIIGNITLLSKSKLLEAVIVKTGSAIKIKGDTTIYTADSFRVSANANVEELLKKMPGIQVDKNGVIKAMGEKVEKVLVDGEEFFGDDPGMAIKNLRADAVKEVQVFDKKSEQAEFSGISDGVTQKTINLKLKDEKKKGYFGKIDAAAGPQKNIDDRYKTNLMFGSFKAKRKFSAFVLNGNTGQDGLNWEDSEKFGGGEENYSMSMDDDGNVNYSWNGDNDQEAYVNTNNGFMRSTNAGVHYNNKWNDKYTLNLSPKYNNQIYNNTNSVFKQTQVGDSTLNETTNNNYNLNRTNFKTFASFDSKLDSNNSLKVTTRANFYNNQSTSYSNGFTLGGGNVFKNTSESFIENKQEKSSFSTNILFKHKFKKPRRTLSLNTNLSTQSIDGTNTLKSSNQSFFNGVVNNKQDLNQNRNTDNTNQSISSNIAFTEGISKKYAVEVSYQITYNKGLSNQQTFGYSAVTNKYDLAIDSLSNIFDQNVIVNRPGIKLNYNSKKFKYSLGNAFGFTQLDLLDKSLNKSYVRNFINIFPTANFTYTYKSNHNLRFNYIGYNTQPTINQLQPLRNNDNYFNQYLGNPNLKPSFTNNFRLNHSTYNFVKELSFYQSLNVTTQTNAITNSTTVFLDSSKTITKPINTNGNFNTSIYTSTWFQIKKIDIGIGASASYSNNVNVINDVINKSQNFNKRLSLYISKSKDKKYGFSIDNNFGNTQSKNTLTKNIRKFNTYGLEIGGNIYYKKNWNLSSDYELNLRQKTAGATDNLSNQLWNATLKRTFKNDEFTAYINVRDILNTNVGIDRNFSDNFLLETRNDRLRRYVLIGFTWNFKNKADKK
jgi:hypothetical protein